MRHSGRMSQLEHEDNVAAQALSRCRTCYGGLPSASPISDLKRHHCASISLIRDCLRHRALTPAATIAPLPDQETQRVGLSGPDPASATQPEA